MAYGCAKTRLEHDFREKTDMYLIRVVLHGATEPDDYERLHDAMRDAQYYRVIRSDNGEWYELPPAMYCALNSDLSGHDLRIKVDSIAGTIRPSCSILVIEAKSAYWNGLNEIF